MERLPNGLTPTEDAYLRRELLAISDEFRRLGEMATADFVENVRAISRQLVTRLEALKLLRDAPAAVEPRAPVNVGPFVPLMDDDDDDAFN